MARFHHLPEESWSTGGEFWGLRCGMCLQDWPCATAEVLRQMANPSKWDSE